MCTRFILDATNHGSTCAHNARDQWLWAQDLESELANPRRPSSFPPATLAIRLVTPLGGHGAGCRARWCSTGEGKRAAP